MGKILSIFLTLAGAVTLYSCSSTGCTDNKNSIPLAGFYSYEELAPISVSSVSIGGVGAPDDSLLVKNGTVSEVYLPFRADAGNSSFFFRYEAEELNHEELFDTITFNYTPIPYFASEECGAMFRYKIENFTCTYHLIDSVGLVSDVMTNADVETIRIYFRTVQPEAPENPDDTDTPAEPDEPTTPEEPQE